MAITRTALGTGQSKTTTITITIGNVVVAGDQLFAIFASDSQIFPASIVYYPQTGGSGVQFDAKDVEANNDTNVVTSISRYSAPAASTDAGARIVIANTVSSAAAIIKISGLTSSPFDKSSAGTGPGGSGTPPTSGATAPLSQADEICIGAIGTEGPDGDAADTWLNSFSAGQRLGTTGGGGTSNITVYEGYKIVSATTAQTAATTPGVFRDWAACIATYKAAATGLAARNIMISQAVKRASYY